MKSTTIFTLTASIILALGSAAVATETIKNSNDLSDFRGQIESTTDSNLRCAFVGSQRRCW